jgi:hypothetical protein
VQSNKSTLLVSYRVIRWGFLRVTSRPSVRENSKSIENILMKLEIWLDGSVEIMHFFSFFPMKKKSGCYDK